jgi:NTP pyrophosphatase (non-canonical NTP hydrolase)
MEFEDYQKLADRTRITSDDEVFSLGLIGELGSIASALKKARRSRKDPKKVAAYQKELSEELGDALWYLTAIATTHGISLEAVAAENLAKVDDFFGQRAPSLFDEIVAEESKLPTEMNVEMRLRDDGRVVITVNGDPAGDPIDSSSPVEDYYKYHDVIHFAFAATLGWSPVLRDLLRPKRKRKGVDGLNIPDDGERARIVEEAISAILFAQAPKLNWYATVDDVPLRTLELIKRVTADYEVKARTVPEWQTAICAAFSTFRAVENCKVAKLTVDLKRRTVGIVSVE